MWRGGEKRKIKVFKKSGRSLFMQVLRNRMTKAVSIGPIDDDVVVQLVDENWLGMMRVV